MNYIKIKLESLKLAKRIKAGETKISFQNYPGPYLITEIIDCTRDPNLFTLKRCKICSKKAVNIKSSNLNLVPGGAYCMQFGCYYYDEESNLVRERSPNDPIRINFGEF